MKFWLPITVAALSLFLTGCGKEEAIAGGNPISGMVWKKPLSLSGSNQGSKIPTDSYVEVYPTLIVITAADGSKRIVPLEYVSDLEIK
ncbi:MAG: hypothetical protein AAF733_11195 [Verrucomicrobiota bacterium]